jgi:hypothetical protein
MCYSPWERGLSDPPPERKPCVNHPERRAEYLTLDTNEYICYECNKQRLESRNRT